MQRQHVGGHQNAGEFDPVQWAKALIVGLSVHDGLRQHAAGAGVEDRLSGLLLATGQLTPHQCVAEVLHTVRSFAPRMHDDATVVCLDWLGP